MSDCAYCFGKGWTNDGVHYAASPTCPACKGSGTDKPAATDHNALTPPENPKYPWRASRWQLLCYYCAQPIVLGTPEAGYRQRVLWMEGMWNHQEGNYNCHKELIRPDIDLPRCHICGTQTIHHRGVCSAAGRPGYTATPMSRKEDEVSRNVRRFEKET
jgi:hypothetical protein